MWDELKDVDLWGGKGCGGSQKCEIAYLNKKKKKEMLDKGEDEKPWEYDCIDVAHFLKEEFKVGTHVDAFDGKVWWKGTLLAVPRAIPKDPKDPYNLWVVRSQTGEILSTDCVRHADLISKMVAEVGREVFTDLVKKGSSEVQEQSEQQGFKVEKLQEFIFPDGTPVLASRLKIESIQVLQDVRNKVLNSDLESAVNKGLATAFTAKWQVRLDKTFFCKMFEKELLRFSELTRHQNEKLGDVENLLSGGPVHLSAPAGSGNICV